MGLDDKKTKVGLALGGGAAKGLAHIGVLDVLEREKIPIDMIAGTSAGALIGALSACGHSAREMEKIVREWDWKQRAQMIDLSLPKSGFIAGKKVTGFLRSIIGDASFSDLKVPFACVATDITTGEEIVIDKGSVLEAVRTSISLPVIFTVVKKKGRYLVDGGLVDPVPVDIMKVMGADFVIAINVLSHLDRARERVYIEDPAVEEAPTSKEPNLFSILMKMTSIPTSQVIEDSLKGADVVIEPKVEHIGLGDFHRAEESILAGGLAAIDAVPQIKRKLSALP